MRVCSSRERRARLPLPPDPHENQPHHADRDEGHQSHHSLLLLHGRRGHGSSREPLPQPPYRRHRRSLNARSIEHSCRPGASPRPGARTRERRGSSPPLQIGQGCVRHSPAARFGLRAISFSGTLFLNRGRSRPPETCQGRSCQCARPARPVPVNNAPHGWPRPTSSCACARRFGKRRSAKRSTS